MTEPQTLFPFDAMWRETGCAYRAMELVRADLKATVAGLDAADLDRDPGHGAPSIVRLYAHAGSSEAWWITKVWRKESVPEAWKPLIELGNLAKPAPAARPSLAELTAALDAVRESTRLALIKVTDAELDRAAIATKQGKATLRWVLHHLAEHEAHHRGQIALLRRLYGKPAAAGA